MALSRYFTAMVSPAGGSIIHRYKATLQSSYRNSGLRLDIVNVVHMDADESVFYVKSNVASNAKIRVW